MIDWRNKSDGRSTFFDGEVRGDSTPQSEAILGAVFDFLLSEIVGKGNAARFDKLFLEVNCDTGRVLAAATHQTKVSGRIDGCSVRIQEIQDYWYDLDERGASDREFTQAIAIKVTELGHMFRRALSAHLDELRKNCSKDGFNYIVHGSEPGVVYLEEHFLP